MISATQAREWLDYSTETGELVWKRRSSARVYAGSVAGCLTASGYLRVGFEGVSYRAHRLVWLWVHGEWPPHGIDHRNGDTTDNRLCNLRPATRQLNAENRTRPNKTNKLGLLGVRKRYGRYHAKIQAQGVGIELGGFDTPEEAHRAYVSDKRQYHPGCTL